MASLTIGKLAKLADTSIDTVRYYEREGLIAAPSRRESGYRDYPVEAVSRLQFIRRAKQLGFTLGEIADLLTLSATREQDMAGMKQAAVAKLAVVEDKIRELNRIREGLRHLVDACPGHGALSSCPIVTALSQESTS